MNTVFSAELPYKDSQWLKLLRYEKTFLGHKSEVDSSEYFLSPGGKTDPKQEMIASIDNFKSNKYICDFPARVLFLQKKKLLSRKINFIKCREFQKFKKKINLDKVSIIFSGLYIEKPASAFGHSLLKLSSKEFKGKDLLSYGVDFAAQVTTDNSLLYGIGGIAGAFKGKFSVMPFFIKLRGYNDHESRDLWEMEIDFTKEEKRFFMAHLWEMNKVYFDYFYFTENCSYHIVRMLDAIKPDSSLYEDLRYFIIPIDTIRPFFKHGYVKKIFLRKSVQKRVQDLVSNLSDKEKSYFNEVFKNKMLNKNVFLSNSQKANVYDALIEFIDFKHSGDILLSKEDSEVKTLKRQVLIARSKLKVKSVSPSKKEMKTKIDWGHSPRQFIFGYTREKEQHLNKFILGHRFSLHDKFEAEGDFYTDFTLEMGETLLEFQKEKFKLKRFTIVNFENYIALSKFGVKPSANLNLNIGEKSTVETGKAINLKFGLGLTLGIFTSKLYLAPLIDIQQDVEYGKHSHYGAGYQSKWYLKLEDISFELEYFRTRNIFLANEFYSTYSYNAIFDLGFGMLELSINKKNQIEEFTSRLNVYF